MVSGNAYMLVYKCVGWHPAAATAAAAAPPLESLPAEVRARASALAEEYEAACADYAAKRAEAEAGVATRQQVPVLDSPRVSPTLQRCVSPTLQRTLRHSVFIGAERPAMSNTGRAPRDPTPTLLPPNRAPQEVRSVLAAAPTAGAAADAPPGFFVPTAWLEEWANGDAPPGPAPTVLLECAHGRLDPHSWQAVKYVSRDAWRAMAVRVTGAANARARALTRALRGGPFCRRERVGGLGLTHL